MNKLPLIFFAVFSLFVTAAHAADTSDQAKFDVTGTWDLAVETGRGTGTPIFTFQQTAGKLTGHYKGQFGEAPVTGTIEGNAISFDITVNPGTEMKIEYSGTVDGDTMKGKAKFGSYGDGTFTGKKRPPESEKSR